MQNVTLSPSPSFKRMNYVKEVWPYINGRRFYIITKECLTCKRMVIVSCECTAYCVFFTNVRSENDIGLIRPGEGVNT